MVLGEGGVHGIDPGVPQVPILLEDGDGPAAQREAEPLLAGTERGLASPALGHVAEDQHDAPDLILFVPDRGGAVGDRLLGAIPGDQQDVIAQLDGVALAEGSPGRTLDGLARGLGDEPEDLLQGLARQFVR